MGILAEVVTLGLLVGGLYVLSSLGLTLIYGVLRVVNFAHGEFIMVGMYITYSLQQTFNLDPYVALPITTLLTVVLSYVAYVAVIQPTVKAAHAVQAFVTLGLSIIMQNIALVIWSGRIRGVSSFLSGANFTIGSATIGYQYVVSFACAMAVAVGLWLWIQKTDNGKAIRATIQNVEVAQLMGIDVSRIYLTTFLIGTGLAGLAGGLFAPIYAIYPTVGFDLVLIAFVVVVLGGMGSIPGAIIGGLVIGVIEAVSAYYLGASSRQIVYFLVFVAILVAFPAGILGVKGSQELGYR